MAQQNNYDFESQKRREINSKNYDTPEELYTTPKFGKKNGEFVVPYQSSASNMAAISSSDYNVIPSTPISQSTENYPPNTKSEFSFYKNEEKEEEEKKLTIVNIDKSAFSVYSSITPVTKLNEVKTGERFDAYIKSQCQVLDYFVETEKVPSETDKLPSVHEDEEESEVHDDQSSKKNDSQNQDFSNYKFMSVYVCNTRFDLPDYYEIVKPLGQGGYGVVSKAIDKRSGEPVAVKKVVNAFRSKIECKRLCRELKMLLFFNHENIISIQDILNPISKPLFTEIYMVNEYMESDLYQIIQTGQDLTEKHLQYFLFQILSGLAYIHSAKVMHRDLKPGNILVNSECDIKICDFGLSRGMDIEYNCPKYLTPYVATRWYRAPELIFASGVYGNAVDIWSVGCILAELLTRRPLFPGKNHLDQVALFIKILGNPSEDDISYVNKKNPAYEYILNQPKSSGIPFETLFPKATPEGIDLLKKMLKFDPEKRIKVADALRHPYFRDFTECLDDLVYSEKSFSFPYEEKEASVEELKDEIYKEMLEFHKKTANFPRNDKNFRKVKKLYKIPTLDANGKKTFTKTEFEKTPLVMDGLKKLPSISSEHTHNN